MRYPWSKPYRFAPIETWRLPRPWSQQPPSAFN
jgi:hypothetical protein